MDEKELFQRIVTVLEKNKFQCQLIEATLEKMASKKHYVIKINAILPEQDKESDNHPTRATKKVTKPIIIKIFNDRIIDSKSRIKAEIENYNFFEHTHIVSAQRPKRLAFFNEMVMYEYLDGKTCLEFLTEKQMNDATWGLLGRFFAELHQKKMVFGDCRLNNFIIMNQTLFIIDYEEMKKGDPNSDLANISSAFLDNYPGIFEEEYCEHNIKALIQFLKAYSSHKGTNMIHKNQIGLIMSGLMETAVRRGKNINQKAWKDMEQKIREMCAKYV